MKKINLNTLALMAKLDDNYDTDLYINEVLSEYGMNAISLFKKAVREKNPDVLKKIMEAIIKLDNIDCSSASQLISAIEYSRKFEQMHIAQIMELYRSGDDFLVSKSKEYVVDSFGKYIHHLIRNHYSTYEKISEELFQCGVIGLLKAMCNYDEKRGAFTTYSKPFILHEITEQLNFINNDSSVHYNNMKNSIIDAINKLQNEGLEPTVQRISIISELKPSVVERELECINRSKLYYLDADEDSDSGKDIMSPLDETPESICLKKEQQEFLYDCIQRLPKNVRDVILLKLEENHTNEEMAKILRISIGQVKTCSQKGNRLMRMDPKLQSLYPERLSDAEREMLKFTAPIPVSKSKSKRRVCDVVSFMGISNDDGIEESMDGLNELLKSLR